MIKYLLPIFILFSSFKYAGTGNLEVKVINLDEAKGYIQIGLFNKADTFPKPGKELKVVRFKVTHKNMRYTFRDLPQGEYALAIYHDINSDKECNRNMVGVPTEKYGFSNNVRPFLSAPSFKSTKVKLTENTSIVVKLL